MGNILGSLCENFSPCSGDKEALKAIHKDIKEIKDNHAQHIQTDVKEINDKITELQISTGKIETRLESIETETQKIESINLNIVKILTHMNINPVNL